MTPKRPGRLWADFPPPKPLSPIASSPETTPTHEAGGTSSAVSPFPNRPKYLQLPSLLNKFVSGSSSSLAKLNRSVTPTPSIAAVATQEKKPLYEAESPDELALVDAAFAYNCRLVRRTPKRVVVSLPGEIAELFNGVIFSFYDMLFHYNYMIIYHLG